MACSGSPETPGPNNGNNARNEGSYYGDESDQEPNQEPNRNVRKETNIDKEPNSLVFNYSKLKLTDAMSSLLNRGLNFSILPLKLDITEVLVDYKKFERRVVWHEFWYGRESENTYEIPMFKTHKTNMPKNYSIPQGLQMYLNGIKSELLDPRNRNTVKSNISVAEIQALKTLIQLQRDRIIKIMACDKGAGIMILDFEEYLRSCYEHLSSQQIQEDGSLKSYYIKIPENKIGRAKQNIEYIIEEGVHHGYITQQEFKEMDPGEKDFGRFYANFKVHKEHTPMSAPPPRPIVSVSGSFAENIGVFVEHQIKDLVWQLPDILRDTPDFLRLIETEINQGIQLSQNSILISADAQALFTNIPAEGVDGGLECLTEALDGRVRPQIPTGFIIRLMEAILENNLFTFNSEYFQQNIGASMGQRPIPSYANIFMGRRIDTKIRELSQKYNEEGNNSNLRFLKRFLDDVFMIFQGTSKQVHQLFQDINKIHPAIKFTFVHTSPESEPESDSCSCPKQTSVPFLDTSCSIKNNIIDIDLHRKDTDRNKYLLPGSCHPRQTCRSIPYSLSMRIIRICTNSENRDKCLEELKRMLLARNYLENQVKSAISKARSDPQHIALRQSQSKKQKSERSVVSIKYEPRLASVSQIQSKNYRAMTSQDQYL